MRRLARLLALIAAPLLAAPAAAQPVEVDLELILMVDVSRSMTPRELEIQRRGYAEALRSDAVYEALRAGLLRRVAMAYVEWAGRGSQRVIVDWRLLETRDDLDAFAATLTAEFNAALRRTSISGALDFAAASLDGNAYAGLRRVIDVSGDGPNNQGRPVIRARDAALARGIVINGLPLMTREGMGSQWHLDDLDRYYRDCVVGGPGAFVIPVTDWADFAGAVRRKLVLEMVGAPPPVRAVPVQFAAPAPYDCLIGEKMWEQRRNMWTP
ncbi:DUF1194 domain-containing protein [Psychromarinibacter sp. C21-152]|uniref:DUF1194 domain-containing protein n=1 Tax=Psychromarinibacter sediminicola TaxID=3033385 RepID=A0AAE3NUV8_9RHOB|nr:DUF1194 domain-containing protein [Psychromarinibacter sediminicola]MDF0602721.1 DUF1194 domain-containing protein [Psychromarinibacter sediminicola]